MKTRVVVASFKENVGAGMKWVWASKGNSRDGSLWCWECGDGVDLDCILVSVLVVILFYRFARCFH